MKEEQSIRRSAVESIGGRIGAFRRKRKTILKVLQSKSLTLLKALGDQLLLTSGSFNRKRSPPLKRGFKIKSTEMSDVSTAPLSTGCVEHIENAPHI